MKQLLVILFLFPAISCRLEAQSPANVAEGIRAEAAKSGASNLDRPLPLTGHWNLGEKQGGFSPAYQLRMIERADHFLLPWLRMPEPHIYPLNADWLDYYEPALKRAAQLGLPISLIGTQWESVLTFTDEFFKLPPERNPNVVMANGQVKREISPFGPVELWREAGRRWGAGPMLKKLQEFYPNPPLVLFISNHEHARLPWNRAEEDFRFARMYGSSRNEDFKRKVVGDGWIARYRALQEGLREGLSNPQWRARARFIAYDAFGPSHFARWPGWLEHSLYSQGRIDPWVQAWDGASPSYYLFNWSGITDYTVWSPQVEAMNWVFMLNEARRVKPDFWFEISTWDGHDPTQPNDKRKAYAQAGQNLSPARYGGMVQFGMWLLRPRVVREFRGYQEKLQQAEDYFLPIVEAVDRVHRNATLREFWRRGELVANRAQQHPYQALVPQEYERVERWFMLDTSLDPRRPWSLTTQLQVYALALQQGRAPQRQWLIYAHAPMGDRNNVSVTIPDYRAVTINVAVAGSFYTVDERTRRVQEVEER